MDDPEDNETVFDLNGDEENDDIANPASSPHDTTQEKVGDDDILPPKNKRKRTDVRRRIRKILSTEQLDAETVSAQKEEQERLRRLELQKSLNAPSVHGEQKRATPPLTADSPDVASVVASGSPVFVDVCSKKSSAVIVIDDSDEDCDIVETKFLGSSAIIEISDSGSDSELDDMDVEDEGEPENSGSHTNDDVNQPNVEGKVLVNVNHPPSEPDIFLSLYLSQCVKPHQIGGIRFLYDNLVESLSRYQVSPGFGCILAHSMGLGKTLQLICFIDVFLTFTKATKVLCIVPMNTIQNWCTEFNSWLPEQPPDDEAAADNGECSTEETDGQTGPTKFRKFKVFLLSDNVKTTVARSKLISNWEQNGGVLLMGYEMYRILAMYSPSLVNNSKLTNSKRKKPSSATTEVIDLDEEEKNMDLLLGIQKALCKPGPDLVVCDEGHRIKNNQANISQALKKIQTRRRVVLTGYPLQNNLLEYWCMVDFVRPNFLGTRHEFSNMFERPIINGQCVDSTASDIKLMRFRAHVLHSLLEGFVQRRSEAILTKSLPEKEEYVIPVKVSPLQMSLYKAFVTSVKNYVGFVNPIKAFSICIRIWNHPDILKSYLDKKDGARNDSPLTVVDPDLDIGDNLNKKTKEAKNDMPQRAMSQEAASTSSDLKVSLPGSADWVGKLFDDYKFGVLQNGAKMVILTEIIEKTVSLGDRILVFSQSLSTLSMIEDFLRKRVVPPPPSQLMFQPVHWEKNKNYYRLDGGTSSQEREKLITAFNSKTNKSVFLFLLSTRACSLGVNLIGANRVVVFDASWNPCHDAQAVCRIYRYGQTKKCFIYRLVSSETFEKRMYERQVTKEGMSDRVIDELNPEANLTKQEVMNLFNETGSEVDGDEPDAPWSADKFSDPVLNHVCEMCRKSISEVPFKHKVQSTQKSKNTLTKAEKREAKKGYEREKRAIDSANKFVPVPGDSPLIREQMRREAVNRPIVHVKPIQNVQVGVSPFVRPPRASLPAVLPPLSDSYLGNIPSMAYLSRFTFPPLHSRYFPQGELTAFPPYPIKVPLPKASGGTTSRNPIVVNLLTSPEAEDTTPASDAGIEKPGQSTRVDEQSDTCIDTQATASSFVCSKGVSDSALLSHGGVNVLRSVDAAMPSESDTADHSIADTNEHSPHSSGSKGQKMDVGDPIEASTKAEPACTEEAASG